VTSFTAKGRVDILRPARSAGSFEIAGQFPDKFVRSAVYAAATMSMAASPSSDTLFPAPGRSALGFNAHDLIRDGALPSGESLSQSRVQQHYLAQAHELALQLLMGLLADSMPGLPVRFESEAGPNADRSVIVSADGLLPTTLWFDPVTHLPARFGNTDYENYRAVDGLNVPFRLVSGSVSESITAFHYNVPIDPKVFRPSPR
jgi:hypothetical protein